MAVENIKHLRNFKDDEYKFIDFQKTTIKQYKDYLIYFMIKNKIIDIQDLKILRKKIETKNCFSSGFLILFIKDIFSISRKLKNLRNFVVSVTDDKYVNG